ncbi:MAG: AarF/ABC1/UbiB kinase family protein [Syntrophales bacterium]|nr:AarF/ABC1/UbiB kinase family protein [Syntrophales bacterium]
MQLSKLSLITHTYKNVGRYRNILAVLVKYGYAGIVDRLNLGRYINFRKRMISPTHEEGIEIVTGYERLRMAFEELGPTFVKMGQILSTRPDLIPIDLAHELSKLQDEVPPFPFEDARTIIEEELQRPMEDVFSEFEERPIAAASIGQVHKAKLVSGEEVAVKVQRPGIRKVIAEDLAILYHLALLLERYIEELQLYRPTLIVDEFARTIRKEINFYVEASYADRFARQFQGNSAIYVPHVFRHLSTDRLLTMEFIEGIKVSDIDRLEQAGYDRKIIASRGTDIILEQIFIHGFFHADPHPGNVFILPDNVICLLDYGMMGQLDEHYKDLFSDIIIGYARRDVELITEAVLGIVEWNEEPNRRYLERDLMTFLDLHLYKPLKELRIGEIMHDMADIISRHQLRIPPDIYLMIKALSQMESIGLVLDPDFDMAEKVKPFLKRIIKEKYHPRKVMRDLWDETESIFRHVKTLPSEIHETIKHVKQGKLKISFEHRGLEKTTLALNKASNRIAFALIISALIIGSSLIINTGVGPHLLGYPLVGILGFGFAGILGIALLISIIRSGIL